MICEPYERWVGVIEQWGAHFFGADGQSWRTALSSLTNRIFCLASADSMLSVSVAGPLRLVGRCVMCAFIFALRPTHLECRHSILMDGAKWEREGTKSPCCRQSIRLERLGLYHGAIE